MSSREFFIDMHKVVMNCQFDMNSVINFF